MLSVYFIWLMILAAHQSGKILQQQGLLEASAKKQALSATSMRQFMELLADQTVKLTPKQRQIVIMRRLSTFVFARWLFGNQSGQTTRMKLQPQVVLHLVTIGIPRQIPKIVELEIPQITSAYMKKLFGSSPPKSVFLDQSGIEWSSASCSKAICWDIKHMTSHRTKPFISIIYSNGKTWIRNTESPDHLLRLIHYGNSENEDYATTCEFHSLEQILAIGVAGNILVYNFSSSLDSIVCKQRVQFFENPMFSYRSFSSCLPKFAVSEIRWHPKRTSFIVTSSCLLARACVLDTQFEVKSMIECAYIALPLKRGRTTPDCSCFLPDGKTVVTGYCGGQLFFWEVVHEGDNIVFNFLKSIQVLEGCYLINKIEVYPYDPSFLAIKATSKGFKKVFLVKISPDHCSSEILQTFSNVKNFQFYDNSFLIKSEDSIKLYLLKSDNKLVKVLEFQSQMGTIESCLLTTASGVIILHYSLRGTAVWYRALCN